MSEIIDHLVGRQINVGKNHNLTILLLQHLRSPARRAAGVESFAAIEGQ